VTGFSVHSMADDTASGFEAASGRKAAIVVASVHHGNTLKIAETIAKILDAELMSPNEATSERLAEFDLVGFGSGIYFGRHHASLRQLVRSMDRVPGSAFVFSTAGLPFLARLFHWPLRRVLSAKGCRVVGEFSCRGWDTVGPLFLLGGINRKHPNRHDVERAKRFAAEVAASIQLTTRN
jgi:flavodoxin